jgi:hypothetical protein
VAESIGDLSSPGREVVDCAAGGERKSLSAEELIARHRNLPPVDYREIRKELDAIIDQSL